MATLTTPRLTATQRAAVQRVIDRALLHEPAWSGAEIEIHEDLDAAGPSIDCSNEADGCVLLSAVNAAIDDAKFMRSVCCLKRDERTGLCELWTVPCDDERTPVTAYGYEYRHAGVVDVAGWGEYDGRATVWMHDSGAHSLLISPAGGSEK